MSLSTYHMRMKAMLQYCRHSNYTLFNDNVTEDVNPLVPNCDTKNISATLPC